MRRSNCRGVCIKRLPHGFGASHKHRYNPAFTILELLIVISIIIVLAGLTLATMGYVQKKGARSRAETEIAAISTALESYKADNGVYPTDPATTEILAANADPQGGNPTGFITSSRFLYKKLSGDSDGNPTTSDPANDTKNYLGNALKPNMLNPDPPGINTYIRDPFGYSYGYSTAKAADPAGANGYNPTFDLWSTGGETGKKVTPPETFQQYQQRWIKNW
ncbi:MAG: bacterial ral secretion pathway protein g signature [Spartobacteria bacterium]|nr:bacterial ral secretion pathway protein g signature [Spartobacteria bacterium]